MKGHCLLGQGAGKAGAETTQNCLLERQRAHCLEGVLDVLLRVSGTRLMMPQLVGGAGGGVVLCRGGLGGGDGEGVSGALHVEPWDRVVHCKKKREGKLD